MTRAEQLAEIYQRSRPRLVRVAYAVLSSRVEAEDVVADCWIRLTEADAREPVLDVEAWAVVAVGRRALDVLRSARVRREAYVGPWLPEPLLEPLAGDPAERVTLDDTVSYALLVVLGTLSPAERTAFVLHDLFAVPFDAVAGVVGRSPAAVRQLASRARRHVAAGAPRMPVDATQHAAAVAAFTRACTSGDYTGLLMVLDPDVTLTSDGGGQVSAARRPVVGADRVARFLLGIAERPTPGGRLVQLLVNGAPGLALFQGDQLLAVVALSVEDGGVRRVDLVLAPDKLLTAQRSLPR